ncbi:MAG TPA: hypothetical protein VH107_01955 [Lacipirellulaceae bacterium]|jgi:hypothetical protein|nr:hypothetical protein [Lacipirellulaceae bacterium]
MKFMALSGVAVALLCSITLFAATEAEPAPKYIKVYNIVDLAVYRTDSKDTNFAPEVLIKYLEASVDPESWKHGGVIKSLKEKKSLAIAQNERNHAAIAAAIDALRPVVPGEAKETRGN